VPMFNPPELFYHPCRWECLGISQMTRTIPLRLTILHLTQIFFTEALTFISNTFL